MNKAPSAPPPLAFDSTRPTRAARPACVEAPRYRDAYHFHGLERLVCCW